MEEEGNVKGFLVEGRRGKRKKETWRILVKGGRGTRKKVVL